SEKKDSIIKKLDQELSEVKSNNKKLSENIKKRDVMIDGINASWKQTYSRLEDSEEEKKKAAYLINKNRAELLKLHSERDVIQKELAAMSHALNAEGNKTWLMLYIGGFLGAAVTALVKVIFFD